MNQTHRLPIIITLCSFFSFVLATPINPHLDASRPEILCEKYIRQIEKDFNGDPYKGEMLIPYVSEEELMLIQESVRYWIKKLPYNDLYSNPNYVNQVINSALIDFIRIKAEQIASTTAYNKKEILNAGKIESNNFMQMLANNPRRKGFDLNGYFGQNFERKVKENTMNGRYRY